MSDTNICEARGPNRATPPWAKRFALELPAKLVLGFTTMQIPTALRGGYSLKIAASAPRNFEPELKNNPAPQLWGAGLPLRSGIGFTLS
jgi:hypothetical protein